MSSGLRALIVFTCLALLAGIGYLVYRASQPTIEDAVREVMGLHDDPAVQVAFMKNDLRNLVVAQERVYADAGRYTTNIRMASSAIALLGTILPSPGVQITIERAGRDGYSARATFVGSEQECVLYMGLDSRYRLPPAEVEGAVACRES